MVSIPNSKLAYGDIENYAARERMLYHPDLPLSYDTSPEQMETIMQNLREFLDQDKDLVRESNRVQFTEFSKHALIINAAYLCQYQ